MEIEWIMKLTLWVIARCRAVVVRKPYFVCPPCSKNALVNEIYGLRIVNRQSSISFAMRW